MSRKQPHTPYPSRNLIATGPYFSFLHMKSDDNYAYVEAAK